MSPDAVVAYFDKVKEQHATGQATEHSYRGALAELMQAIDPELTIINEARRIECGSPDLTIMRGDVPVGYVEAKDVGLDIRKMKGPNADQQKRYRDALPNLIYTNGLDFDFYRHTPDGASERIADVSIADYLMGLQAKPQSFDRLTDQLTNFANGDYQGQTITSSARLAKIMADKAKLIRDAFGKALVADEENESELAAQFLGFKETLIHDITKAQFADIYAETIVYGMFAARYHDPTLPTFSREEAMELLPASNPFLKKLFQFVAVRDLDSGVRWAIDELVQVFRATDVKKIMDRWSDAKDKRDPFLHFYESFLAEYNPAKRKSRGVWYTPEPVVNFLVRAVDDVLRDYFGIVDGLASTEMVDVEVKTGQTHMVRRKNKDTGKMGNIPVPTTEKRRMHRVQILDPATGTGTFLAEVIKQIEPRVKEAGSGVWSNYVEEHLIPRLHGFELLMASYAMCHMKLDMMLSDSGYVPSDNPPRLSVYLTNTLDEPDEEVSDLFMARWLSDEARGANAVKREKPVMCIVGNPPYSGHSSNKGEWIESLMADYKRTEDLRRPAQAKWLSDDYVKFLRFAEHMIAKNGEGVLAFITNHSYLDNPTFHDMRLHLLETFDSIRIVDLHGNSKKGEIPPDGQIDENVFDIIQGVSLIVAVKQRSNSGSSSVHRMDLWGRRAAKQKELLARRISDREFVDVSPPRHPWLFVEHDWPRRETYYGFPSINEVFSLNGSPAPGIVTTHDEFAVSWSAREALEKVKLLLAASTVAEAREHFRLCGTSQWSFERAQDELDTALLRKKLVAYNYRPFDCRYTIYDRNVAVHRRDRVMSHFLLDNLGIVVGRQGQAVGGPSWNLAHISKEMIDFNFFYRGGGTLLPLYLYPEPDALDQTRRVNMAPDIRTAIEHAAEHPEHGRPDEVAIFDYIYGVLHCPAYRKTYAEFLKIDFPRVPYPPSGEVFWDVAEKGGQLRRLHLIEPDAVGATPYSFEGEGDNEVTVTGKKSWKPSGEGTGSVFINDTQSFEDVPMVAWEFWIGGYQPAQKWLKDRKGRTLSFEDVKHYQKIVKVLVETDRIMKTIEMPLGEVA